MPVWMQRRGTISVIVPRERLTVLVFGIFRDTASPSNFGWRFLLWVLFVILLLLPIFVGVFCCVVFCLVLFLSRYCFLSNYCSWFSFFFLYVTGLAKRTDGSVLFISY